ncbi:MAG: PAS domain S-box protein [Chloroflexaceae bacterium]|nr:PAS domain S-box protein [Chloroflexaceae bacterium]
MADDQPDYQQLQAECEALKQRIHQLEQSEERLRLAVESSRDGMWDWDVTTGAVYYSPRWMQVLGYRPNEIENHVSTWERLIHPDDAATVMDALQQHLRNETPFYEAEFRLKTGAGDWLWAFDRGKVVARDEQGQPLRVVGSFTNISQQKESETQAHQMRAELEAHVSIQTEDLQLARAALDHAADAIFWTDERGTFQYANDAACQQLGYTHEELLQLRIADVDAHYTPDAIQHILDTLPQSGPVTLDSQHRRKDGRLFAVEVVVSALEFANRRYIISFARDITERKRAEDELRLFQTIVERANDAIGCSDAQGTIIYSNPAHRALFGYGDEIIGMPMAQTVAPAGYPLLEAGMQQVMQEGSWHGESINQRKDGSIFPADVSVFTIVDDQGTLQKVVGFVRDITEKHAIEARQQQLQQQLIEAQQAAIRELSTPLLPISNHVIALPLIGAIDDARAQQVIEVLLEGISTYQARIALIDVTGVKMVDTQIAQVLVQAAQAVKLLGAEVILTGIQPQIAQTLVALGADLSGILTRSNLQAGIAYALRNGNARQRT